MNETEVFQNLIDRFLGIWQRVKATDKFIGSLWASSFSQAVSQLTKVCSCSGRLSYAAQSELAHNFES